MRRERRRHHIFLQMRRERRRHQMFLQMRRRRLLVVLLMFLFAQKPISERYVWKNHRSTYVYEAAVNT
jgi:hypothetical protein